MIDYEFYILLAVNSILSIVLFIWVSSTFFDVEFSFKKKVKLNSRELDFHKKMGRDLAKLIAQSVVVRKDGDQIKLELKTTKKGPCRDWSKAPNVIGLCNLTKSK